MTQDERWTIKYSEVVGFIQTNQRNPSKHRIEEHDMLNWVKANRKLVNAGKMKPERVEDVQGVAGADLFFINFSLKKTYVADNSIEKIINGPEWNMEKDRQK